MSKFIFFVALITLLSCKEQPQRFVGLWKIYAIETQDSTGRWTAADWMKNGQGYLHYDNHKNMSIHFTPEHYEAMDVPDLKKQDWDFASMDNFSSDYWYVGAYKIIDNHTIEHLRIMHSDPSENNVKVRRGFAFSGDTLIISAEEFGLRLKWLPAN